jgi:hypothetical protein
MDRFILGDVATGVISTNMSGKYEGWFRIQLGNLVQWITLIPQNRHFDGRHWSFRCPVKDQPVSVLWKPNGATRFRSRQAWGRQVAYQSQFNDATNIPRLPGAPVARNTGAERELAMMRWGMPPPPKFGGPPVTNIRNGLSRFCSKGLSVHGHPKSQR